MRCSIDGCLKPHLAKGLCQRHYDRLRRYGDTNPTWDGSRKNFSCSAEGCGRPALSRELCTLHLQRFYKYGVTAGVGRSPCNTPGCNKIAVNSTKCFKHKTAKPKRTPQRDLSCSECGSVAVSRSLCRGCYDRLNSEHRKEKAAINYRNKKGDYKRRKQKRKHILKRSTPEWLSKKDTEKLNSIYKECPAGYEVDHIVPLNSAVVCGLHVPWNLQYLTPEENRRKSNKLYV